MSSGETEEENLTLLAQRLLLEQEEERERIARLLHDDLGQQVASLSILTGILKRRLSEHESEPVDRIREKLVALAESMRKLSQDLYPSVLEHAGVVVALRLLCDEFGARYESDGDFSGVSYSVGLCLYRIAQDVLRTRCALAMRLAKSHGQLALTIESSGRALFEALSEAGGGLALTVLRQRARSVSGEICLETGALASRLTASVPC
jgi:signal transduction histidine kinase